MALILIDKCISELFSSEHRHSSSIEFDPNAQQLKVNIFLYNTVDGYIYRVFNSCDYFDGPNYIFYLLGYQPVSAMKMISTSTI